MRMNEVLSHDWFKLLSHVIFLLCFIPLAGVADSMNSPLMQYLEKPDPSYVWSIHKQHDVKGVSVYELWVRSQTWQDIVWTHQLRILVPKKSKNTGYALLFLTGGSNENGEPRWKTERDKELELIGRIAQQTGSLVTILRQVPNQPLYDGKKEDELISFTFMKYFETQDTTWPLLVPMVKSAVRAMDTIQDFSQKELGETIDHFIVSGASKRGWTTWLTGASDARVAGIAPMVIDTLNMKSQMDYQLEVWGEYSQEIEDYSKLGIQEKLSEPEGKKLREMVDPYAYIDQITIPKYIFIGTNDAYWPVDAIKHYFNELKGEKYIRYIANVGHGLGTGLEAAQNLAGFFSTFTAGVSHPKLEWTFQERNGNTHLIVDADESVKNVKLWISRSDDRDFRDERWYYRYQNMDNAPHFQIDIRRPNDGYQAVYAEVSYSCPIRGTYSKCTRVYVLNESGLVKN